MSISSRHARRPSLSTGARRIAAASLALWLGRVRTVWLWMRTWSDTIVSRYAGETAASAIMISRNG
jgi:hypothetical protein